MALRLGIVGRGRWGQNIERTLLSFPDVAVEIIAKGAPPSRNLAGVLISTPGSTHAQVALPYIEAGIATFIEKPMATMLADAERIRDAAGRSGAVVFVGHVFLYNPAFIAALELVPSLGQIRHLLCEGMNDNPRRDSSVLWDWLPHDLSMAAAILGRQPDSVMAWSLSGAPAPESAVLKFQFGDVPVISTVSWISPVKRRQVMIVGETAALVFDDGAAQKLKLYPRSGEPSSPAYAGDLPLTRELQSFVAAIRAGKTETPHIPAAMDIIRAIAGAQESAASGGRLIALSR